MNGQELYKLMTDEERDRFKTVTLDISAITSVSIYLPSSVFPLKNVLLEEKPALVIV